METFERERIPTELQQKELQKRQNIMRHLQKVRDEIDWLSESSMYNEPHMSRLLLIEDKLEKLLQKSFESANSEERNLKELADDRASGDKFDATAALIDELIEPRPYRPRDFVKESFIPLD